MIFNYLTFKIIHYKKDFIKKNIWPDLIYKFIKVTRSCLQSDSSGNVITSDVDYIGNCK